jgi:hypothetical protein
MNREAHVTHGMIRWVGTLLVLLGFTALAQAQEGAEKLRIGAGLVLDFAGDVDYDPPGRGNSFDDKARVTPGLRAHLDYDVHRYVSVGGLLRFGWWRADDLDDGRNLLVDVAARVNAHYDWRDFRFLAVLGLGPTFNRLNDDNRAGIDNPGVGVAASFAPGFEWWITRRVGLFAELFGWTGHFFHHDTVANRDMKIRLNQVLLELGVAFSI